MTIAALVYELNRLHTVMDESIDGITLSATKAQELIYKAILLMINDFEIRDGRYVIGQNYAQRLMLIERKIKSVIADIYEPSIGDYLSTYHTIEERNINLQKSFNDIKVATSLLAPAKQTVYKQAEYYLVKGLADAYVQPAKYLLMQHVNSGISINDSRKVLKRWNEGNLSGQLSSGRQTPTLQSYATQISRDSMYQYYGTINNIIKQRYQLDYFIYTGNIIEDSRPFCRHLVDLDREIAIDEVPKFIDKYPKGLYPNTTKENFLQYRGGYNCRHGAFAVRKTEE